jgi:hypothetical protein
MEAFEEEGSKASKKCCSILTEDVSKGDKNLVLIQ